MEEITLYELISLNNECIESLKGIREDIDNYARLYIDGVVCDETIEDKMLELIEEMNYLLALQFLIEEKSKA